MTLEQLRVFVAVAERQHMTQGARDLNLTQSATSAAIAALESRHAIKLFHRIGRRIELTDAGRSFLPEAKAILAQVVAAEKVLGDLAELRSGSLALAASQTVANYWLPAIIHGYRSRYPGITVSLTIGNTERVCQLVQEGKADLGFIEGEIENSVLLATPIADDEMVLVVAKDHPWAAHPPPGLDRMQAGPWILRERGSGTRSILETALEGWGLKPEDLRVALELPSNESVRTAVEAGGGVTAISKLVVADLLHAGSLVQIDVPLPRRSFFALQHNGRYVTKAVAAFLATASKNEASEHPASFPAYS